MDYENKNVIAELRDKLISYITTLDENVKDVEDLDFYRALDLYKKILGNYKGAFDAIVDEQIADYRNDFPEETLSDIEIIDAMDIYNPTNYFSLLVSRIEYYKRRLREYQENSIDLSNYNGILSEDADIAGLINDTSKNVIICTRGIEKCERIIHIIEQEYVKGHTR